MVAPAGNKFALGNKGGGRKGYEYETKQLKEMTEILNEGFRLGKKVIKGTASKKEIEIFLTSTRMVLKIMDKMHANKQHILGEFSGEIKIGVEQKIKTSPILRKAVKFYEQQLIKEEYKDGRGDHSQQSLSVGKRGKDKKRKRRIN